MSLVSFVERHGCVWYLPIFGALVGVVIGGLLRVVGEAVVAFEMMVSIVLGVFWDAEMPENTVHECFA